MACVALSLGTNLGNKEENLRKAVEIVEHRVGTVLKCSDYLSTEPWGFQSPNCFLNAALLLETKLSPLELLDKLIEIERDMGRTNKSHDGIYADRIIDIDILYYEQIVIRDDRLTLPHPLMQERRFVLEPLVEIAPYWEHPLLHLSVKQMFERLS